MRGYLFPYVIPRVHPSPGFYDSFFVKVMFLFGAETSGIAVDDLLWTWFGYEKCKSVFLLSLIHI